MMTFYNSLQVYIFDINSSKGNETVKELKQRYGQTKATFIQCDVADKNQFTGLLT